MVTAQKVENLLTSTGLEGSESVNSKTQVKNLVST
jgi:hypothetical protein